MAPTPQKSTLSQHDVFGTPEQYGERIVISGMSGLYPESRNVKEFSEILYNKVNPVSEAALRFKYNHPEVVQQAGTVPELNYFDAQFFKVHFRLGNSMDPMARKILEQSYQAIYDAGINPEELSGKKVGVYIGTCFSETEKACFYKAATRSGFGIAGCSKTMFANRISYWLNAKGPSMSIDEACCSSTAALEQAYLAMSRGDCEAAVVGGAYLCLHPQSSVHYGRLMKLCPDGKTKSFDENADGCAKSEAINVLFLQKAKDALRIYAEVLHAKSEFTCILLGETGPMYGFYRDVTKTVEFIKKFYEEARVSTRAIEYVEAFGCAVPEADKVELQAIEKVFCNDRHDPLLVGSVMSNIGYNEAASGISAITKVLLGYHTGQLAANLHCSNPRQDVEALREGRMRVVTEHQRFGRTYVAVNGMSVTGINSHVLLHGHYKPKDVNRYKSCIPYLVTISARHDAAVENVLNNLKSQPIDPEQFRLLHNIHQASITGHLGRGFIILKTNEENQTVSLCEKAEYFDNARRPLWFVYSGMGSQWAGMGTQLMRLPIFATAIERCRKVLEPKGIDIEHIITSTDENIFDNILHSFVGIAAVQIGLTDILRDLGLVPDGIIGHSVGELGCAYADGCLTAEEMILSAYSRGLVSLQTPFIRGSMAAVGMGFEQISNICPPEIEVACHNGPESSTISGPADVMRQFVAELTAKGIFAKEVPCSNIAYHSRYIADAGPQLLAYLSDVIKNPKPRSERWLSTSVPQGRWNEPSAKLCSAEYHTNNLLSSVLFEETSRLVPQNAVLVEIAPHGLLQAILKRSLPSSCRNIALTRRKHPDNTFLLLEAIGKLFMEGYNPRVHILYPKVDLPVSTGTPFLSDLVGWAHGEKWPLPLYRSASRKAAATCDYVISLHDNEHCYLQGHTIRGRTLYPFAATLVLVWDTFAMTIGMPKKQMSVQFTDLHLYAQPVLHDQRQLRLNLSLHRGNGSFEVLNEGAKVIAGYISLFDTKNDNEEEKTSEETEEQLSMDITGEDIYKLLKDRDYSYSGEFRSIQSVNEFMNEARIEWCNNWVTFIDGLLQLNVLRQSHDGASLPTHIRIMRIDLKEHEKIINKTEGKTRHLKANVLENFDATRCGGIVINNIKFENWPQMNDRKMSLKSLKFISNFQTNIDIVSSLEIYLQIVAENLNKENINVVGIVHEQAKESILKDINLTINNVQGVTAKFEQINFELVLQNDKLLSSADLVLVHNLSTDDKLCQLLHRVLQRDQFVVSEEDLTIVGRSRKPRPYRVLSLHTIVSDDDIQKSQLQLARWGAKSTPIATTTVCVQTHTDIVLLKATRYSLPQGHRLLVVASNPPPRGLKELISDWRKEANCKKIQLVMLSNDKNDGQFLDELPDNDLVFNVLNNGNWGGMYYVPVQERASKSINMTLKSNQIGDYDSLSWVEALNMIGPGITVTVHYAGINNNDVKMAGGSILHKQNIKHCYGMDFSGTTDCGERVMGLVRGGAASSVVRAQAQLLWPVPPHWSLEDAATVPLAYAHALYCLVIKSDFKPGSSVLIHGGAGALGQAAIAIALAHDREVFTTVSDVHKKRFLLKLFPKLKADHIGNSRDESFGDMVRIATNGFGCSTAICSVKGNLKMTTSNCISPIGKHLDVCQLHDHDEKHSFGMYNLMNERAYIMTDLFSIFDEGNIEEAKVLHMLLSEGISRGYVRPLSRVTYAPHDVSRAFRLLAASRHRGRVLLRMHDEILHLQPRLICSAYRSNLIICNDEIFGLQFADRLVQRGAKKLCLHFKRQRTCYRQIKIRSWEKSGVEVVVFTKNLNKEMDVLTLLNKSVRLGPLEGVYMAINKPSDVHENILTTLDLVSGKLCPDLKYFAVINIGNSSVGKDVCLRRLQNRLPAIMLTIPELNDCLCSEVACVRGAVDATERALRVARGVLLARSTRARDTSLLLQIAALAGVAIPEQVNKTSTLKDLGVQSNTLQTICHLLRVQYNIAFEEEQIYDLTVDMIQELEKNINDTGFKDVKDLSIFINYVDSDELQATTEMIFLPTLTNSASMRDDEFDTSQSYLCIVPGIEGHYERFRVLCERLKLGAIVLQPGLDKPRETVRETAQRFAEVLLKKTGMKYNFYLLGYESGIFVALEIASILEDHGLTGTVYCLGLAPDEFGELLKKQPEFQSEERLQDAVVRHMFSLMAGGDTSGLETALQNARTWKQKVDACVRSLRGRVPHSAQYARALIDAALARITSARSHTVRERTLRSQLVLLRAATAHAPSAATALQRHSQRPVPVHQLRAPLAHAARDLRCAAIINAYLDPAVVENFHKRNICNTYLLNADSFMTLNYE